MSDATRLLIGGRGTTPIHQYAAMSNRHGLVAGATGTGKTVTLQRLAEEFSRLGVPVFAADVKGDLSGLAAAGIDKPFIRQRLEQIGVGDHDYGPNPVLFWDLFGRNGHPVRATVSEMGPLLLGNLLELNETQGGVLYACFRVADDQGMLLLDLKDLKSMLQWVSENAKALSAEYGNLAPASIAAIQRRLLVLEEQGGDRFFGEPALKIEDLMITDFSGRGVISLLDATRLIHESPRLYATFLLWLLSELFEELPERGDADRPKLVLFFDEAHLIFDQAPKPLLEKIEQVVRLIRSKGVGVYFVTQSPLDIPEDVLGQLGMKVQHALRAFTPKDRKAIKSVAESFRENPDLDTATTITELGIGEALVSVLDPKGMPTPVERTLIAPPRSRIGPLTEAERGEQLGRSPLKGRYDELLDRRSAFEMLTERARVVDAEAARAAEAEAAAKERERAERESRRSSGRSSGRQSVAEAMAKSVVRSVGSSLGRQLVRGILGSLFGGRR